MLHAAEWLWSEIPEMLNHEEKSINMADHVSAPLRNLTMSQYLPLVVIFIQWHQK